MGKNSFGRQQPPTRLPQPKPETQQQPQTPTVMKCTVEWVDGYRRGSDLKPLEVFQGEDVGVNPMLQSTIAVPLVVERIKDETGKITGEKTVFLMHTFIKSISFERLETDNIDS